MANSSVPPVSGPLLPQSPRSGSRSRPGLLLEEMVSLLDLSGPSLERYEAAGTGLSRSPDALTVLLPQTALSSHRCCQELRDGPRFRVVFPGATPTSGPCRTVRKATSGLPLVVPGGLLRMCHPGLRRWGTVFGWDNLLGQRLQAQSHEPGRIEEAEPQLEAEIKELLRRFKVDPGRGCRVWAGAAWG